MPLYTFGGSPADVLTDDAGNVVPDYPLLVKVAGTGAVVTALFEEDGTTPISTLRSNDADSSTPGAVRTFKALDVPEIEYEYLDAGGQPVRWYQAGRELAAEALASAPALCRPPAARPPERSSGRAQTPATSRPRPSSSAMPSTATGDWSAARSSGAAAPPHVRSGSTGAPRRR
jgi:hypothetical protein